MGYRTCSGVIFFFIIMLLLKVIAHARNGFAEKFGVPRQSGRTPAVVTRIVFVPEYRVAESLRGIDAYSHLWLLWGFSANMQDNSSLESSPSGTFSSSESWSPTVRPPRLGGNKRMGVFATRSPFRPNPIGLSSVRLLEVKKTAEEGIVLMVEGADLMDGTPIYDIKPYLPYTDCHAEATGGFAEEHKDDALRVDFPAALREGIPQSVVEELTQILSDDPRPAYHHDRDRVYGLQYGGYALHFQVEGETLCVVDVKEHQR